MPMFSTPLCSANVSPSAASSTGPASRKLAVSHATTKAESANWLAAHLGTSSATGGGARRDENGEINFVIAQRIERQHQQHREALQNKRDEEGMLTRRCIASAPTDMPPYKSAVGITATGFRRARRATMIPTKPTPPLIPSISAVLRTQHFHHSREASEPAREKCGQHDSPPDVDAGVARSRWIETRSQSIRIRAAFFAAASTPGPRRRSRSECPRAPAFPAE